MADLVFATKGQAEMLAAQEAVRKKAMEAKLEFEEAAKATGSWDAAAMKLKSSAETALRSIHTEQEKIIDKIAKIEAAQAKGLVPPKEAEESIKRLRQQWIDVDEATLEAAEATTKAREETEAQERAHLKLKSSAESALRSIQTEEERLVEQIEAVEAAMSKGLIPPPEAEAGLAKLRDHLKNLGQGAGDAGANVLGELKKAFSPMALIKVGLSFVGVKAGIDAIKAELKAMQDEVDERAAAHLEPKGKSDELADELEKAQKEAADAKDQLRDAEDRLSKVRRSNAQTESEFKLRQKSELRDIVRDFSQVREDAALEEDRKKRLAEAIQERDRHVREMAKKKVDQEGMGGYDTPKEDPALDRMNKQIAEMQSQGTSLAHRRRIEELQRRQADIVLGSASVDPAAANEAAQDVVNRRRAFEEAERKVREAAQSQRAFVNSPEGLNLQRQLDLQKTFGDGFQDIVQGKNSTALSTQQIEEMAKVFRASGQPELFQKLNNFADRINDGTISEKERARRARDLANDLRDGEQAPITKSGFDTGALGRPATEEELRVAVILERIAIQLDRREQEAARQRDETNRRLDAILQKEGGLLWTNQ